MRTFKEVKNHEVLPCGCEMATGVDWAGNEAFLFQPCRPDCEYYQYVLEQSKEMGQPTFPAFGTIAQEKAGQ